MYEGKSVIIRNEGIPLRFAALLVRHDAVNMGLSHHCGVGLTFTVLFCHAFRAVNKDAPRSNCTKEGQRAVISLVWTEGVPGAAVHTTLSMQRCFAAGCLRIV
jgi:hypothetical protein